MRAGFFVLLLAGCAAPAPMIDVTGLEPGCARQCLGAQSSCTSTAGITGNRWVAGDVLRACDNTARQCLSTCPAK